MTVGACSSENEATDYTSENREAFLASCTDATGDSRTIRDICECAYERIERTIPFDEFVALDDSLALDALTPLPDSVSTILADCFVSEVDL